MMYGDEMMNGWHMMSPLMGVFMLLLWGFAIFGLICAVRRLTARRKTEREEKPSETPLDILKKRYAGGEIDSEEFERIKKDLE